MMFFKNQKKKEEEVKQAHSEFLKNTEKVRKNHQLVKESLDDVLNALVERRNKESSDG